MSEVKRYGHIGYLVTATPHLMSLYSEMRVYVSATDFDSAVTDFNTAVRQKMEFAKDRDQLKAENEALRKALVDIRESVQREYWDEYAGLEETRAILDAAMKLEIKP